MGAMQHGEAGDDLDGPLSKKQRHVWTSEAHHKFSNIVEGLGDSKEACQPSSIWSISSIFQTCYLSQVLSLLPGDVML